MARPGPARPWTGGEASAGFQRHPRSRFAFSSLENGRKALSIISILLPRVKKLAHSFVLFTQKNLIDNVNLPGVMEDISKIEFIEFIELYC